MQWHCPWVTIFDCLKCSAYFYFAARYLRTIFLPLSSVTLLWSSRHRCCAKKKPNMTARQMDEWTSYQFGLHAFDETDEMNPINGDLFDVFFLFLVRRVWMVYLWRIWLDALMRSNTFNVHKSTCTIVQCTQTWYKHLLNTCRIHNSTIPHVPNAQTVNGIDI